MDIEEILKAETIPRFTDEQIIKFSEGFLELIKEYEQATTETLNHKDFQTRIGERFTHLMLNLDFYEYTKTGSEYLLEKFREKEEYKELIKYVDNKYHTIIYLPAC